MPSGRATGPTCCEFIMDTYWEHFEHGADIGVRGVAPSKQEAFAQAAVALCAVITDIEQVATEESIAVSCSAVDDELLLVEWLNTLIFEMATRRMLFARFDVEIDKQQLVATAWGEPLQPDKHQPAVEVKGATYTALRVAQDANDSWRAECVVDV